DGVAVGASLAHPELGFAVPDVAVELDEGAGIEQLLGPLAREELAPLALLLDRALAARVERVVAQLLQPLELGAGGVCLRGHGASVPLRRGFGCFHRFGG